MATQSKKNRIEAFVLIATTFIVMTGLWAVFFIPETASAAPPDGKGGGGKKGADIILARVDFVEGHALDGDLGGRVDPPPFGDGHPDGGLWDYWAPIDPDGGDSGVFQCDVSGGGRWKINTDPGNRWVVFHWNLVAEGPDLAESAVTDAANPDLDQLIYVDYADVLGAGGPDVDPAGNVDNLNMRISAGVLFKDGSTRQPLGIPIQCGGGSLPIYKLVYTEDLYIVRDQSDPDVALLTTFDPSPAGNHVHEAKLFEQVDPRTRDPHNGTSKLEIGTYNMPLEIIVRRVYVP